MTERELGTKMAGAVSAPRGTPSKQDEPQEKPGTEMVVPRDRRTGGKNNRPGKLGLLARREGEGEAIIPIKSPKPVDDAVVVTK